MSKKKTTLKERLPIHPSPNDIWQKIDQHLDSLENENIDSNVVMIMPIYRAPDIFEQIKPKKRVRSISFITLKIAASIILILALPFTFKHIKNKARITVIHTVENQYKKPSITITQTTIDADFKAILNQKCQTNPNICQLKEFDELFTKLNEIELEERELKKAYEQFKSTEIESHILRILTDKIKIESYILQLFS